MAVDDDSTYVELGGFGIARDVLAVSIFPVSSTTSDLRQE